MTDDLFLEIADLQEHPVPGKDWFLALLGAVKEEEGWVPRLSLALVDDARISELHLRFLGEEGATDVMAFPMDEDEGEVVLSVETARREAKRLGSTMEEELALYFVHGVLHLLGYGDHDEKGRKEMIAAERRALSRVGILPEGRE